MTDEPAEVGAVDPFGGRDWSDVDVDEHGRVRVRRKRRRHKRRRRLFLAGGLFLLIIVAGVAWLLYDGLRARSDLMAVKDDVPKLRSEIAAGHLDAARITALSLQTHANSALDHTNNFVWGAATHLPFVGGPLRDARNLAAVVDSLADDALPQLVQAAGTLDPKTLRGADGSIDVAAIERTGPALEHAHTSLNEASARIAHLPKSSWASINSARQELANQLPGLANEVASASLAANVVPPLLGIDGPKNYMITFVNEAEMRGGGGGLPGAFAIMHVDHGSFHFSRFEPDGYLSGATATDVHFGRGFDDLYSTGKFGPESYYANSNLSPHYPYAAQIWLGMWRAKTGQTLNGAFAIDPTALSYLLAVSGPVTLPDKTIVDASNVVALTQSTIYGKFATNQQEARKQYLLEIAKAISNKLLGQGIDTAGLIRAAARAAGESRLLFWTSDTSVEEKIAGLPIAGVEPETTAPYFRLSLWNSTGSKLDYYIHASMDWTRTGCGAKRDVVVTVKLSNTAPDGLPRYVLGLSADKQFHIPPGDEYLGILAYGTHGADLKSYTVDGKETDYAFFGERGHPVWSDGEFVPQGKTVTLVYRITEPAGNGDPIVPAQPMVNPMAVTVHDAACR